MSRILENRIVELVNSILKKHKPETRCFRINPFDWLVNKPIENHFKNYYGWAMELFRELRGNERALERKKIRRLPIDSYFNPWNFIFELDEIQHFTSFRMQILKKYPQDLPLGFDIQNYIGLCQQYHETALIKGPPGYKKPKPEFPFLNGRAAQRAFFDMFKDILPPLHGLNPTFRVSEFEIKNKPEHEIKNDLEIRLKKHLKLV